jgi:hypothetical protein
MNAKLTAKETALMQAIADGDIDFFRDGGLEAGANCWSNVLTGWLAGSTKYLVSDTERGVASVAKSLCKKGLLETDGAGDDAAYYLTELGAEVARELHGEEAEEVFTGTVAEVETPEGEAIVTEWTTEGTEDTVSWTEITFPDASRTIKRRQKVSGAWRTDYWGAEFAGDAERLTTSAKVKEAIARGNFVR